MQSDSITIRGARQNNLRGFDVTIRVEKQTNESYRGLDLTYAEWEPADDDLARARLVTQNLQALLGTTDL